LLMQTLHAFPVEFMFANQLHSRTFPETAAEQRQCSLKGKTSCR